MLYVGFGLILTGPLLDRLLSFEVGSVKAAFADLSRADAEIANGKGTPAEDVLQPPPPPEPELDRQAEVPALGPPRPPLRRVVLSERATAQAIQLPAEEKFGFHNFTKNMLDWPDGGGTPVPGSDRFYYKNIDDRDRLRAIYRKLDPSYTDEINGYETDGHITEGYGVLELIRPGHPLWELTDN